MAGLTRSGEKAESTKESGAGRLEGTMDLKMKEKEKVLKWTQLEIRIHPESFFCGKIDKGKVAKSHVTTEISEYKFLLFFSH